MVDSIDTEKQLHGSFLNSSASSLSSENFDSTINHPLHYADRDRSVHGLSSLRSVSRINTIDSGKLSVNNLYPNKSAQDIELKRTKTTNTILSTISQRVERIETSNYQDEEQEYDTYKYPDSGNLPVKQFGEEFKEIDPELVTWESDDDPEFPRNWSIFTKWWTTILVSIYNLLCGMGATTLSPALPLIAKEFNIVNDAEKALVSSIFILAWAISPLLLSPLSEMYGRKKILNICVWLLLVFNISTACAQTLTQLCVLRFVAGLFALAPLTIGGGVLGDLFDDDHRNLAMGVYSVSPNLGPIFSPIISSWLVAFGWRWCIWWVCVVNGLVALCGLFFYKETYSPALLRAKAAKLRKESGNQHLRTVYDIADGETLFGKFYVNITRPLTLLFTHPMVIGLGSFMAFSIGFFFLLSSTYISLYQEEYGFSVGISGLMWIPLGVANVLGIAFWTWFQDTIYHKQKSKNNGVSKPEFRLPGLIVAGFLMPGGLIIYGWTLKFHTHWVLPAFGASLYAFTLTAIFQVIQNYLIDMNPRFSASALAAAATYRCLFGFLFPLFGKQMYKQLGYGWGNTMLALIAFLLGVPFPLVVVKYGEQIRLNTNKRLEKKQAKRDAKNLLRLRKQQGI